MLGAFAVAKQGWMKNVRLNTMDAETGALAQATMHFAEGLSIVCMIERVCL